MKKKNLTKISKILFLVMIASVLVFQFSLPKTPVFAEEKVVITPDSIMDINFGDAQITYGQQQTYISTTAYGMKIVDGSGKATSGSVSLKNPIDINAFSINDYYAEILPVACDKIYSEDGTSYTYNSMKHVRITLTDAENSSNYLYIEYQHNNNYHCNYDTGAIAQSWATYVLSYITGMRELPGSAADATTRSGFYFQIETGGASHDSGKLNPYSLRFSQEDGKVLRANGGEHTLTNTSLFESGKVYIKVDFSFNDVGNGIIIKSLGGVDCSGESVKDISKPVIKGEVPSSLTIFDKVSLSSITAEDFFDGDITDEIAFTLKCGSEDKTQLINENEISFDVPGDWTLTAKSTDASGNVAEKTYAINVYMPEFEVESPYYGSYFLGEKLSPIAPSSDYPVSYFDYTQKIAFANESATDFTADYTFNSAGKYFVECTATLKEEYGGTSITRTFEINVISLNLADAVIFAGQGAQDIDLGLSEGISMSQIQIFASTDTQFTTPLSVSNIPAGNYLLKIALSTEGREEDKVFYKNVSVISVPNLVLLGANYSEEYTLGSKISPIELLVENYSASNYSINVSLYHNGTATDFSGEVALEKLGFYTVVYQVELKDIGYTKYYTVDFEVVNDNQSNEPIQPDDNPTSEDQPTSEEEGGKGACKGSLSSTAGIVGLALVAVAIIRKKKED